MGRSEGIRSGPGSVSLAEGRIVTVSPNLALQRSWTHKLHQPMGWRAAAELRR
jgi:hypothetical protein